MTNRWVSAITEKLPSWFTSLEILAIPIRSHLSFAMTTTSHRNNHSGQPHNTFPEHISWLICSYGFEVTFWQNRRDPDLQFLLQCVQSTVKFPLKMEILHEHLGIVRTSSLPSSEKTETSQGLFLWETACLSPRKRSLRGVDNSNMNLTRHQIPASLRAQRSTFKCWITTPVPALLLSCQVLFLYDVPGSPSQPAGTLKPIRDAEIILAHLCLQ